MSKSSAFTEVGPTRDGEDFARAQSSNPPNGKKARFDTRNPSALAPAADDDEEDEEEDAYLEADELTNRGNRIKRNAVNIDGFDSDSSNGGFDVRAADKRKKAKKQKPLDDAGSNEDDDMFADAEQEVDGRDNEDEGVTKSGKRKKDVRFANLENVDDLEEVGRSKSGGHVSADFVAKFANAEQHAAAGDDMASSTSEESDVADEVRAQVDNGVDEELGAGAKKRHAPKLDAFNLNQERQEGGFDQSLNFVRTAKDPDATLDNWMEGMSKKDIRKAGEAHARRELEERKRRRKRDELLMSDLLAGLAAQLQRGETPLEALARLGPGKKDKKSKWATKMKHKKGGMDVDGAAVGKSSEELKREKAVEAITEAADALLQKGETDVYSTDREMLKRLYKRETGEELVDPPGEDEDEEDGDDAEGKMWEFRWSDARDGGETHGPYNGAIMKAWSDAEYFGEGVGFRVVGSDEWTTQLRL